MKHKITLNIASSQDIIKTLDYLMDNYDEIAKDSYEDSGLEFYDNSTNNVIELDASIHPEIPNYSELAFYLNVVDNEEVLEKVEKFTQMVIEKNSSKSIWMNDEVQMGLSATFALAFKDKRYISNFVDVLRTFNLNHEVYEPFFIELLVEKWGICDETLFLLATRSVSIEGQWGIDEYELPELNSEQKDKFVTYLLKDTLKAKVVFSDVLLDTIEILEIPVDANKFESLFEYDKPQFNEDNIPDLSDLQ